MTSLCRKCPEVLVTRKCCFCVPVRRGVIIFAYINLVLSLLSLPLLVFLLVEQETRGVSGGGANVDDALLPLGTLDRVQLPLSITFVVIDTALTVTLLVAAHKKLQFLLVAYVWAGAVLQVAMLLVDVVYFDSRYHLQNVIYFIFLGLNVYQLYLVRCVAVRLRTADVRYVAYRDQREHRGYRDQYRDTTSCETAPAH